jgi:exocyst complex protein 7
MKTLIMKLLGTLQTDASNLKKIAEGEAAVNIDKSYLELKANLYLMNNSYYVLNQLGPSTEVKDKGKKRLPRLVADKEIDGDDFKIESDWFTEVVGNVFSSALQSYLSQWESLKNHLTSIDERSLEYQGGSNLLSLESGRILKSRFSGFNDEFERLHNRHKGLMVEDGLKEPLTTDIRKAFYGTYKKFFDNYSK